MTIDNEEELMKEEAIRWLSMLKEHFGNTEYAAYLGLAIDGIKQLQNSDLLGLDKSLKKIHQKSEYINREEFLLKLQLNSRRYYFTATTPEGYENVLWGDHLINISAACAIARSLSGIQPCEDVISRKDLISQMESVRSHYYKNGKIDGYKNLPTEMKIRIDEVDYLIGQIEDAPPVQPKQRAGHWIYDKRIENWKCSECGCSPKTIGYVGRVEFMREHFKFCNHCGAKMTDAIMEEK